jgi:SOS-response transcriptional repressor LexA
MTKKGKHGTPTKRQHEVLCFVSDFTQCNGISPTLVEIGDFLGINKSTVSELVSHLRRKALVFKKEGEPRSIQVTDAGAAFVPDGGGESEATRWRQVAGWLHTSARLDEQKTGRRTPSLEELYSRTTQ